MSHGCNPLVVQGFRILMALLISQPMGLAFADEVDLYHQDRLAQIALRWAPIHLQDVDQSGTDALGGKSDYLTAINYDGDWDPTNNWEALPNHPAKAVAYYSVVHSQDYAFIIYAFYHPRDWVNDRNRDGNALPAPIRNVVSSLGAHENDLEGFLAVVRRKPQDDPDAGELLAVVTVFHFEFYRYSSPRSELRDGEMPINGAIRRQKDGQVWRLVSAQQASGHGLKLYPDLDLGPADKPDGIRYLPSLTESQEPKHPDDRNVRYKLISIFETGGLWDRRHDNKLFAKYGVFKGDGDHLKHDAAHAPWKWRADDRVKSLTGGEMAVDPLKLCEVYFTGWPVPLKSQTYTHNPYRTE